MPTATILIADDHALIRQTWSFVLNTHERFTVIGESSTGEQTIALVHQLRPDIVVMDICMPGLDGLEATRRIRFCSPLTNIIAVTSHTNPAYARKMLQYGAKGYVTKSSPAKELFTAIDTALAGGRYLCQQIKDTITEQVITGADPQAALEGLSRRERQIIRLVCEGWPSAHIARELFISEKTVEVHRYNVLKKLNLKNTPAMVHYVRSNLAV